MANTKKDPADSYRPYTYTDFREGSTYKPQDSSGNDYAAQSGVSQEHYDALSKAWADWQAADKAGNQAGKDAAHAAAEAIRNQYGYSGGEDGSQYIPAQQNRAPDYTSKYQGQIDNLLGEILNREDFHYNYLEDPLYQQYRQAYTREGNRAMQDTMGQSAARTGGYLSTAGEVAAQQANNLYMAQLSDKIPELQQLAYSMYLDDINGDRTNLGLLQDLESFHYGKYQDKLNQFNTDRNFKYNAGRDQIADSRYEDETEYNRNLDRAQLLAAAGDYSGYKNLGYSDSEVAMLKAAAEAAAALKKPSGSGSSRGSRNSGSSKEYDLEALFQAAYDSGNPYTFLKQRSNYKKYGLTNQPDISEYNAWVKKQDGQKNSEGYGPKYKDLYRDAYTMRQNGYSNQKILEHLDRYDDGITDAGVKSIIEQLRLA